MKLNYKNIALNLLDKWNEEVNVPEGHKPMTQAEDRAFGRSILEGLEKSGEMFRNKIQYISQPFYEAYLKGRHKLADVFDKEEIDQSGTWIWQAGQFTHTNFYYLKTHGTGDNWHADYMFIQFSKHSKNDFKSIDVCISGTCDENDKIHEKTFIWKGHYDNGCNHVYYFAFLVTFICFMKYCETETKIIKPNGREKHIGTKYVNETRSNIEIVDSTWFTTIVRSEGFSVRGHFRFQPYGVGMQQRKLIWISDFEKSGYTRTAKILNQ